MLFPRGVLRAFSSKIGEGGKKEEESKEVPRAGSVAPRSAGPSVGPFNPDTWVL